MALRANLEVPGAAVPAWVVVAVVAARPAPPLIALPSFAADKGANHSACTGVLWSHRHGLVVADLLNDGVADSARANRYC
ncbi:hypothetical protein CJO94_04365 [Ralstonia solanacearum]|nr:hypothetical protein CJO94_04365 [Ralstonia solanacearum]